jgi:hypothetical protein
MSDRSPEPSVISHCSECTALVGKTDLLNRCIKSESLVVLMWKKLDIDDWIYYMFHCNEALFVPSHFPETPGLTNAHHLCINWPSLQIHSICYNSKITMFWYTSDTHQFPLTIYFLILHLEWRHSNTNHCKFIQPRENLPIMPSPVEIILAEVPRWWLNTNKKSSHSWIRLGNIAAMQMCNTILEIKNHTRF